MTRSALAAESQALRHCVVGYAFRCAQGVSQIYALTCDERPQVTIELDARGWLVQMAGTSNRAPSPRERELIATWLRATAPA